MPPSESCSLRARSTSSIAAWQPPDRAAHVILLDLLERDGNRIVNLRFDLADANDVAGTLPPNASAMIFLAIAPAATRATVSRALARPPPRQSRKPYLAS
jgi:hypothetical protein